MPISRVWGKEQESLKEAEESGEMGKTSAQNQWAEFVSQWSVNSEMLVTVQNLQIKYKQNYKTSEI